MEEGRCWRCTARPRAGLMLLLLLLSCSPSCWRGVDWRGLGCMYEMEMNYFTHCCLEPAPPALSAGHTLLLSPCRPRYQVSSTLALERRQRGREHLRSSEAVRPPRSLAASSAPEWALESAAECPCSFFLAPTYT